MGARHAPSAPGLLLLGALVILTGIGMTMFAIALVGMMLALVGAVLMLLGVVRLVFGAPAMVLGVLRGGREPGGAERDASPPGDAPGPPWRRPAAWKLVLITALVVAVALGVAGVWSVTMGDRGEILYLGSGPIPGESERIARHRIVYIDDPNAFRERVDERTRAIIIPASRVQSVGEDWVAAQSARGVALVVHLDDSAPPGATAAEFGAQQVRVVYRGCQGGGWEQEHTYDELRRYLTGMLDREYMVCRMIN